MRLVITNTASFPLPAAKPMPAPPKPAAPRGGAPKPGPRA